MLRRYEPVLNDPRDSGSIREIPMDLATPGRSRSPSITPRSKVPLAPSSGGEQFFAKRARKLRDSWSFRSRLLVGIDVGDLNRADLAELSQGDEDELVAVSFAGLYDLERGMHRYPSFLLTVS